jgi:hypothetical protein
VINWGELAFAALIGAIVLDLTLFGFSVRTLGLGRWFEGPEPGERVTFNRKVSVPGRLWSRDEILEGFRSAGYPVAA